MKAVIYARFSSHNQREESIEGQVRACQRFAKEHDMTVIRYTQIAACPASMPTIARNFNV